MEEEQDIREITKIIFGTEVLKVYPGDLGKLNFESVQGQFIRQSVFVSVQKTTKKTFIDSFGIRT